MRANTASNPAKQGRSKKSTAHRSIPHAHGPGSLCVTDGAICCGYVVAHDGGFFSFLPSGELCGEFDTKVEAVRSLPFADFCGVADVRGQP